MYATLFFTARAPPGRGGGFPPLRGPSKRETQVVQESHRVQSKGSHDAAEAGPKEGTEAW